MQRNAGSWRPSTPNALPTMETNNKERLWRRRSRSVDCVDRDKSPGRTRIRAASPFTFMRNRSRGHKNREYRKNKISSLGETDVSVQNKHDLFHENVKQKCSRGRESDLTIKTFVIPNSNLPDISMSRNTNEINWKKSYDREEQFFPSIECVVVDANAVDDKYDCDYLNTLTSDDVRDRTKVDTTTKWINETRSDTGVFLRTEESKVKVSKSSFENILENEETSSPYCSHCKQFLYSPIENPAKWPQRPLLLRATPGSRTRIIGIRFASEPNTYLKAPWPDIVQNRLKHNDEANYVTQNQKKNQGPNSTTNDSAYTCPYCQILPINNGNEALGESLVTDFESDLFKGSLLLRIKNSTGTFPTDVDNNLPNENKTSDEQSENRSNNYFHGVNRSYQAVIRGHFKAQNDEQKDNAQTIPILECVTGQAGFQRPCGYLPPRFIRSAAVKILSLFAPQLQTKFDGIPKFLSPLASTPQVVIVNRKMENIDIEQNLENGIDDVLTEPETISSSLLSAITTDDNEEKLQYAPSTAPISINRAKHRKKIYDKLYDSRLKCPMFHCYQKKNEKSISTCEDNKTEYTFEFLQHLVNFQEFHIDLGNLGKLGLSKMLDGQPLKIMAAHQVNKEGEELFRWLWCFDIWHEKLYDASLKHKEGCQDYIEH